MRITEAQIGLTTRCNSHCRFCFREELKRSLRASNMKLFKYGPIDLPFESFKNIFSVPRDIQLCGNKGDAIFHPEFNKFLDFAIDHATYISLATNGSAFSNEWWRELGGRFNGEVTFALDGMEDTHSIYRGTSFKKVLSHMTSFIEGGGRARWQFIVFKHNEHQVKEAKKFAKEIGCQNFITVISRFYDDVMQRPSSLDGNSTKRELHDKINIISEKHPNLKKLMAGEVVCQWKRMRRVYVDSRGYVYPCCFLCCQTQDWFTKDSYSKYKRMVETPENNIANNTIENISDGEFFQEIYSNVNNIECCDVHCTNIKAYKTKIRKEEEL